MSRKQGRIIARGPRRWLVRVSIGLDLAAGTRKYVTRCTTINRRLHVIWIIGTDARFLERVPNRRMIQPARRDTRRDERAQLPSAWAVVGNKE